MNKLQTVLDALEYESCCGPTKLNEAIAIVKEMMAQDPVQQTISTEHGPWLESKHPGEEGECYCKRCLLRDKFLGARPCTPHIVEESAAPQAVPAEKRTLWKAEAIKHPKPVEIK